MDKFSNFTIGDADNYFEYLTTELNETKNINLFLIEFFSSSLKIENYFYCDLEALEKFYKKPYGEELKKTLLNKFFPDNIDELNLTPKYVKGYIGFIMEKMNDATILEKIPYLIELMNLKIQEPKLYTTCADYLVDYLWNFEKDIDYTLFKNFNFSYLKPSTILQLLTDTTHTIKFYNYILTKTHIIFDNQDNMHLLDVLLFNCEKTDNILSFLVQHEKLDVLQNEGSIFSSLYYQPKLLKKAKIQLEVNYVDLLFDYIDEKINIAKFLKNLNTFFGEKEMAIYFQEKFSNQEKTHDFLLSFCKKDSFSQTHIDFIDFCYDYLAPHGCPFNVIKENFFYKQSQNHTTINYYDAMQLLNPHLAISEVRLLDFKMKNSRNIKKSQTIKL